MIPANEWWAIIQNYGMSIFPAQILFYLAALAVLVVFFINPGSLANKIIKGYFVLTFGWIGMVFFLFLGQDLPAHNAQTFLFITLAVLFFIDLLTGTTQFTLPTNGWRRTAMLVGFGLVLVAYPLTGLLLGRPTSKWIIPGTYPCPTTAFALVFMATTLPAKRRWLYLVTLIFLLIWAIPFPIMIQIPRFGIYEDSIMLLMGLYALALLPLKWKQGKAVQQTD